MRGCRKDLVGQKFGRLSVEELLPDRDIHRNRIYRCRCECGNYRDVISSVLTAGYVTECRECAIARQKQTPRARYHFSDVGLQRARASKKQGISERNENLRSGRLVFLRPLDQRAGNGAHRSVLCRCDCGNIKIATLSSMRSGNTRSCGCLLSGPGPTRAKCPSCGKAFPVTLDGSPTPQFCPDCAPKYAGRNWNVCPVCDKLFAAPPSANTVTCSKECSAVWRRRLREGVPHRWSEEAKARLKAKGQTANLKLGTKAAQKSPIAGRFETNQEAKIWTLIDPSGQEHVVRNLAKWARENAALFGKEPGDKAGSQICHGFAAIHQTLRGVRKSPAMTYFGWTLKDVPRDPD